MEARSANLLREKNCGDQLVNTISRIIRNKNCLFWHWKSNLFSKCKYIIYYAFELNATPVCNIISLKRRRVDYNIYCSG